MNDEIYEIICENCFEKFKSLIELNQHFDGKLNNLKYQKIWF